MFFQLKKFVACQCKTELVLLLLLSNDIVRNMFGTQVEKTKFVA